MSETEPNKRGFFSKLFGLDQPEPSRPPEPAPAPLPELPAEPVAEIVPEAAPQVPAAPDILLGEDAPLPVAPPEPPPEPEQVQPKRSWWRRLRDGLSRTSSALTTGISDLFTKRKLDAGTLEDLEDILIQADLGLATSARIAKAVGEGRYDKQIEPEEVKAILAREVEAILTPVAMPLVIDATKKPFVILMVGVNGSGKSTLLKIMAGLDKEFQGEAKAADGVKRGYLEQEPHLDDSLTVRENVEAWCEEKQWVNRFNAIAMEMAENYSDELMEEMTALQEKIDAGDVWDVDSRIEMAMDALRCPPDDWSVTNLSGGEKRRVALARLLLSKPDMLLMDEPTNHLDAESVAWLQHHLENFPGCVILVTHDRYFLDQVTKWIAVDALQLYQQVPIIDGLFSFTLAYNTGAAFSFLADASGWQRWLFAGIAVVVSVPFRISLIFSGRIQWLILHEKKLKRSWKNTES
mgnify:CR=1 FL=1